MLQALKADPTTAQIPVVVVTGLSQQNEEKLLKAGAAAFVEKGSLLDSDQSLLSAINKDSARLSGFAPLVNRHDSIYLMS